MGELFNPTSAAEKVTKTEPAAQPKFARGSDLAHEDYRMRAPARIANG
jgi:hypothetical protein